MSRHTPWEIGFLPTPEYGLNGFTVMNRGRIGEKEAFRIIRLFTAAPELLEACEAAKEALIVTAVYPDEMREQLETGEIERRMRAIGEEEFDPKRRVRTLLAINAVIAKAKGES